MESMTADSHRPTEIEWRILLPDIVVHVDGADYEPNACATSIQEISDEEKRKWDPGGSTCELNRSTSDVSTHTKRYSRLLAQRSGCEKGDLISSAELRAWCNLPGSKSSPLSPLQVSAR